MSSNKIVFIETSAITTKNMSGVGHTLLHILRTWQDDNALSKKFEIFLLCPIGKRKKIRSLGLRFPIKTIPMTDRLLRVSRKFNMLPRLDRVIGRGLYVFPNYWNWPLAHSKSITYIYDVSFLAHPELTESRNQSYLASNIPIWLERTDGVITVSNHAKEEIVKYCGIDSSKVHVVHNGVDTAAYDSISLDEIKLTKDKYGINKNYLLFVGNIEPRKNISRLISAYKLLPVTLSDKYDLVIVGSDGWNNKSVTDDIHRAISEGYSVNRIHQFVTDDDLAKLYAGATLLVHPALYEGFGMTTLEAMAAGTPIIVSDNSSLPEVVGDAGLYINAEDEHDISAKMRMLLEKPGLRKHLRDAGRKRIKLFKWQRTVSTLVKCVESYI